ncbi:GAF and ANTAR domain-containing protein [Nocardiopsis valliformis]|uniref:GAF and ANTAR domain-containing protein n=1 Tax=Nocardiopsis valliformis TaxID=239974 RepID=UPI000349EA46|nr:GAF and ANTAR domain-containing protein [Nocardiopsis valliformis]
MSVPQSPEEFLQRVWVAVAASISGGSGGTEVLALVGRVCTQLLPVDGASISMVAGARTREALYSGDETSDRIQRLQVSLGEGPSYQAYAMRRPILLPDLAADPGTRWPVFATEIGAYPVGALFAFPLQRGAITIGALDLYRRQPGWLSSEEVTIALRIVDIATLALLALRVDSLQGEWVVALPLERAQVHQATGMLISGLGVTAEQALAKLRAHAFAVGRMVDEIADDLVCGRILPADIEL